MEGMRFKGVVLERRKEVKTTLKNFVYKIKLKLLNTYNSAESRVKIGTVKVF